ncbi:MAG: helix-turn-helix domain-containing protein [Spirochaeta sp.]|nr:helix-turn-helix domain-containing protein [Spirochaeta sp.]
MREINLRDIDERHFEAYQRKVALVETLLDESIDEADRLQERRRYVAEHGVSERTIRNYLRRYRDKGAEGLLFHKPKGPSSPRIHDRRMREKILDLIEQRPSRTVPQLRRLLSADKELAEAVGQVSDRSIYRFLAEAGLTQKARREKSFGAGKKSYHKFEASCSMELVQGDARDVIWLPKAPGDDQVRKTYLFAWVDDYSRRILHAEYFWDEKLPRMEKTFKTMVLRWGIPKKCYLDNGHVYISTHFAFILAQLGIKKIHHGPYKSWAKGKVEAVMKTIKRDFQAEAQRAGFKTLEELNSALWAWLDVEYNRRNHSSTGEPPALRFEKGLPQEHRRVQDLEWFENLFLLYVYRKVAKWGTIKFEGNQYHTEAAAGSDIEVRYNPFDLRKVWRFENGRKVETLGLKKLVNPAVEKLPVERQAAERKVSAEAAGYFTSLRERQAELDRQNAAVNYHKLKAEGQQ